MVYIAAQDPNCSLRVIGEPFFRSGYGIALQKNSTWTSIFSQKLLQYEKFDTFLELAHRWMKTSCGNEENGNSVNFNKFHRMTAYDVSGMFVVLGVAVGLCWIMLAAEFYYKRLKRRHRDDQ
jgi:polypeptide N-acetylgalactosaminyltransferase/glutamate receptor 1